MKIKRIPAMITAITLCISAVFSQSVKIYYIFPGYVCPGDTINVLFKWDNKFNMNSQFNIQNSPGGQISGQIASYNTDSFYYLPKTLVSGDTIYHIKIKTHIASNPGPAYVSTDWINTTLIYFKKPEECEPVGINEYRTIPCQDAIIRSLYGPVIIRNGRKTIIIPQ